MRRILAILGMVAALIGVVAARDGASPIPVSLRERAAQGDAVAQFYLGKMYTSGRGVPIDYVKAATWMQKAAKQGLPEAQHYLGAMYAHGVGVPQDALRAFVWLDFAAEHRKNAASARDAIAKTLSPADLLSAQDRACACFEEDAP